MSRREKAIEPSDVRRFADLLFQIIHQIGSRSFQGRSEAEEERGDEADQKVTASTVTSGRNCTTMEKFIEPKKFA